MEQRVATAKRRPGSSPWLTMISLMVLIGIEVFAVALAGGWAIAGLFELGDYVGYGLMFGFGLIACWLMVQLWRKAATRSEG
ncbi:hypothetical protein [Enterovirga sp.]|uniref:hypothetical protein n=1 Tax=Enterovirga sp. TaxID=2026350 RepID=UPI00263A136C|nr:hypothetical protein [Enterovirga sp.]MDB5589969.1 hypothetical protein [Enterovirga sp.]